MLSAERTRKLESGPAPLDWDGYGELVQRDWRDLLDSMKHHDGAGLSKISSNKYLRFLTNRGSSGSSVFPVAMVN